MILLIDNYDSFVYNLARYIGELGHQRCVKRNDAVDLAEIMASPPSHIIISPGPGGPTEVGISLEIISKLSHIPILGVCLGHQAIAQVYGGLITRAKRPMHGKVSTVFHNGQCLFVKINNPLEVARYHSLIISPENFPTSLEVTARCDKGEIMAIRHRLFPTFGVQFHPESILTQSGYALLNNFCNL